jgi:signal transduction histidine kinase
LYPSVARSAALFPLRRAEGIRGFVLSSLPTTSRPSLEQVEFGRALAGLVATAMERAELYEGLRTQLQHVEVLYGLSDAVAGTADLSRALSQLNHLVGEEIGFKLESISIANERLRGVLDAESPAEAELEAIRSWRSALGRRTGRLVPCRAGAAVLVPIVHGSRIVGVLRVLPTRRSLDAASEDLLMALGTACAEVIDKAGLRKDLAESEHRLAIAAERERIAQGLHNSVGQLITGLGMRLANHAAEAPDEEWRHRLEELVDLTTTGSRQMGEAIHSLLFFQSRRGGLVQSLRDLTQTFEATSGVATVFRVTGRVSQVEPTKEDALFRVAHEALTNVQRHSGASSVSMTLTYETDQIALAIRDYGSGFGSRDPFRQRPGHFGLLGIQRRLEEEGGELLVANANPRGVLIEARIRLRRRRRSLATHPGPRR